MISLSAMVLLLRMRRILGERAQRRGRDPPARRAAQPRAIAFSEAETMLVSMPRPEQRLPSPPA